MFACRFFVASGVKTIHSSEKRPRDTKPQTTNHSSGLLPPWNTEQNIVEQLEPSGTIGTEQCMRDGPADKTLETEKRLLRLTKHL